MKIKGKVSLIRATGHGLIAEIALKDNVPLSLREQTFYIPCPYQPRDLDVDDEVEVTVTKLVK